LQGNGHHAGCSRCYNSLSCQRLALGARLARGCRLAAKLLSGRHEAEIMQAIAVELQDRGGRSLPG
jgi:hypothetical protein